MPVMRVHHVRTPERIQSDSHFRPHPAEQGKAHHVIGIGVQVGIVIRAAGSIV
ncbi:Uncharacterised protein [Enterobacter cloacae]|nr:Uncharacterised protein [Enterobacter cloacae]